MHPSTQSRDLIPASGEAPDGDLVHISTSEAPSDRRYPGFSFLGWRLSYIKSDNSNGWGHDEGDVMARGVFCLVELREKQPQGTEPLSAAGWRLVAGQHSFWLMR